ncbi:MAG: thiamine phosphate synthase, partial [Gemmatimonadales bacterium]|nr:thiamine phosphate synthase [Gemmatimonadales bacterium]
LVVSGRPDVAALAEADGVQLARGDLRPADARALVPGALVGASVHSADEARAAAAEGADYLLAGNIHETASHPGRPAAGLALVEAAARTGLPVIAIGGMTPARAADARQAGAWGVAAIGALWHAPDPHGAALAFLDALLAA